MFEYAGGIYPGVWVYDGSGAQVVGVRLYLSPGVLSDPIPLSQVRVVGSTVGGIINSSTPPLNPPAGTVWLNSGVTTQNGIPPQQYGYWNGTTWVLMGSGVPQSPLSGQTAPTSPAIGAIWYNSGTNTTSGIPPGGYGYWNGSTWVNLGTSQPQLGNAGGVAGVQSLNNLSGAITLAEGSGIDITQAGNTITVTATGVAPGSPGVSSMNGLTGGLTLVGAGGTTITPSGANITIEAPAPAAAVSSFNGRTGAVVPVAGDYPPAFIGAATGSDISAAIAAHAGAPDPHAQYMTDVETYGSDFIAANVAPTGASAGQIWRNTSGSTVSGVAAGNFAVRTPAGTWLDTGSRYPFLVAGNTSPTILTPGANNTYLSTNGSGAVGWTPLAQKDANPGWVTERLSGTAFTVVQAQAANGVLVPYNPGTELVDTAAAYSSGIMTIPAGLGGVWMIGASLMSSFTSLPVGGAPYIWFYISKNDAVSITHIVTGNYFAANGQIALPCVPGDEIRFWIATFPYANNAPQTSLSDATITGSVYANLAYPN